MVRLTYLGDDGELVDLRQLEPIRAWLQRPTQPFWLDLEDPSPAEGELLHTPLGFHPLAIEDCWHVGHHPKLEEYDGHFFLVFHGVIAETDSLEFQIQQTTFFISQALLVTFHRHPSRSCGLALETLVKHPKSLERGLDFLLYRILDQMVDYYLPVLETYETQLDRLEDAVLSDPSTAVLGSIFDIKQSLARLRRTAAHQKEILNRFVRGEVEVVGDKAAVYLRDVYDHLVRIVDLSESYRDLAAGALEIYLTTASNRLAEVTKLLTIFATIMLPLSLIAGVYGMNFDFIPGLHSRLGFWITIAVMGLIATVMLAYFRRRGWL